jgi:hypothetical protein
MNKKKITIILVGIILMVTSCTANKDVKTIASSKPSTQVTIGTSQIAATEKAKSDAINAENEKILQNVVPTVPNTTTTTTQVDNNTGSKETSVVPEKVSTPSKVATSAPTKVVTPSPTKVVTPAPATRASGIDQALTDKINQDGQTIIGYNAAYPVGKTSELVQSAKNIVLGQDVVADIKIPWQPSSTSQGTPLVYKGYSVNVVVGETTYYYTKLPAWSNGFTGFGYAVAYWDASINNYKLYYVRITLN